MRVERRTCGRAHHAAVGHRRAHAAALDPIGPVVIPHAVAGDRLAGRDRDEGHDGADERHGRRRRNHGGVGVRIGGEEEAVSEAAHQQDEGCAVCGDGGGQRTPEQRREGDAHETQGQRGRAGDRKCVDHLVELDPTQQENETEERDGKDEEQDDERHRREQLAPEDRERCQGGDEEKVERLPLAFAADRARSKSVRDEAKQPDLKDGEVHAIVAPRAA